MRLSAALASTSSAGIDRSIRYQCRNPPNQCWNQPNAAKEIVSDFNNLDFRLMPKFADRYSGL
jgi:hypothetical protein